jgi:phosphopantetheine adenylyltransferase
MINSNFLIVGRFQGFHNGHFQQLQQALNKTLNNVVVAIGVGIVDDLNPFDFNFRVNCIKNSFSSDDADKFLFIPLYDDLDTNSWLQSVSKLIDLFDISHLAGSKKDLSTTTYLNQILELNPKVTFCDFTSDLNISGTLVRELLNANEYIKLSKIVPQGCFKLLTNNFCIAPNNHSQYC